MKDQVLRAAAAAIAGGLVGWAANAIALTGRVDAIEKGLARVETSLQILVTSSSKGAKP